jgi:hypothetical protein
MKKNGLILLCLMFLVSCVRSLTVSPPDTATAGRQDAEFLESIVKLGKNGDWLIIRGYHPQDDLIVAMTGTPLSHAGILDMEKKLVIEALAGGVTVTGLDSFIHKSHRIILIRPKWAAGTNGDAAIAQARKLVGRGYDFLGLVGIDSKKRFYCTELAMYIYREHQKNDRDIPKIIQPAQMYLWGTILYDSRPRN